MEIPGKYKTAGTTMLVAGIFNILWSIGMSVFIFIYAGLITLSTFGLGIFCYACMCWPILPFVGGIVEVITGYGMMNGKPSASARTVSIGGLVVAVLNMSVIPLVLELVTLISLNDEQVAGWLEENAQG